MPVSRRIELPLVRKHLIPEKSAAVEGSLYGFDLLRGGVYAVFDRNIAYDSAVLYRLVRKAVLHTATPKASELT